METYYYEASKQDGSIVTGNIEVANERLAVDRLQGMGYYPLRISRADKRESITDRLFSSLKNRVTEKDLMAFTYQLGVLLDAGFPLERSLMILAELGSGRKFGVIIKEVLAQVRSGRSFSDSLGKFPRVFPLFYINMIKAGEAGGFLEDVISRMSIYLENSRQLKEDVRSALIYPLVLSLAGGIAVIILLTFVVPKFTKIFTDMGEALPLPTVILLGVSNALVNYWWVIVAVAVMVYFAARKYIKSESGKSMWDNLKFRVPVLGKLYTETAVSRFARTFGTLLGSGVPILSALQIVKGTLESERISQIVLSVREAARKGKGISETLKNSGIFPPIAVHMITVGEETGKLDEMLLKVADRFEMEVRTTVKRLLSLLEPALILIMGMLVGFIVIAMLIAIFSINELPF